MIKWKGTQEGRGLRGLKEDGCLREQERGKRRKLGVEKKEPSGTIGHGE